MQKLRLGVVAASLLLAAAAFAVPAQAAFAGSGQDRGLSINAHDGVIDWRALPGPPAGTYHVHFWSTTGYQADTPTFTRKVNESVAGTIAGVSRGNKVCAELWYHNPAGGGAIYGSPCAVAS